MPRLTERQAMVQRRALQRCSVNHEKKQADFRLRDYLSPGGRYPYDDLASDLEAALAQGYTVYLFSVPGFMMLAGHPDALQDADPAPWHPCDYNTEKW
jgi:hypothetical protein